MDEMSYDDGLEPDLVDIAAEIERNRPIPNPGFRGDLGRRLNRKAGRMPRVTDTVALRRQIFGMAGSGGVLLAIAGIGLLGVGPLAA